MIPDLNILHHSNFVATRGGMQAVIRSHLSFPRFQQLAVGFRDLSGSDHTLKGFHALEARAVTPISRIRRAYRGAIGGFRPTISVYHNAWGAGLVAKADRAPLRVAYLHAGFPGLSRLIRTKADLFDAFLCVSPAIQREARAALPDWPEERFIHIKAPVAWPSDMHRLRTRPRRRCLIGISGRVTSAQKRLDRLPELMALCDLYLNTYEVQILGTGPLEAALRRRIGDHPRLKFLGWREGPAYWETVASWRYILSLSDFEGLPLSLIEAAGTGVVPIYPDLSPDLKESRLFPEILLYPPGDLSVAVRRIAGIERNYAAFRAVWMDEALAGLAEHREEAYHQKFMEIFDPGAVIGWRPLPKPRDSRSQWPGWLPLIAYHWMTKQVRNQA